MKFPSAAIFQCEPDACFFSAVHKNYTGLSVIAEAFSCIIAFHILYQLLRNSKEQFEGCSITHLFSASVVCSFYAEFLTLLAVLSSEMVHGEKKATFEWQFNTGKQLVFRRLVPVLAPQKLQTTASGGGCQDCIINSRNISLFTASKIQMPHIQPTEKKFKPIHSFRKKMPFKRKYFKRLRGVWFFMCFLQLNDITCQNLNGVYSEMQVKICQELWSQINYLEYINFPGISVQKPVQKYNVINRRFCWERFSQRWFLYSSVSA